MSEIEIRLNTLNYLLGKEYLAEAIHKMWEETPKSFSVLDILIAIRAESKKMALNRSGEPQLIEKFFTTEEGVIEYIQDTGLEEVFRNKQITNLVDYVFGVEVGLDTNARKNRSGNIMKGMVANILTEAKVKFEQEVSSKNYPEVQNALGVDEKRFDFVIVTSTKKYLVEVNFYNKGGGSKPNEVTRSYTKLANKINACEGYEFLWVTDGIGWQNAKGKLAEAFYAIPSVYNLTTFKAFAETLRQESNSI